MVYSVQVKRLRNENPLDALILQTSKRKRRDDETEPEPSESSPTDFVFKLAHTYNSEQPGNRVLLEGYKDSPGGKDTTRKFRSVGTKRLRKGSFKSKETDDDDSDLVPHELRELLADYIRPQQKPQLRPDGDTVDKETEDYVYDVYFSEPAGPVTVNNVGYIELNEQEEKLLFDSSDSDNEDPDLGGDEDSNAEDYYKNEYPDEEESDEDYFETDSDTQLGNHMNRLNMNDDENGWSAEEGDAEDVSYERYGWR